MWHCRRYHTQSNCYWTNSSGKIQTRHPQRQTGIANAVDGLGNAGRHGAGQQYQGTPCDGNRLKPQPSPHRATLKRRTTMLMVDGTVDSTDVDVFLVALVSVGTLHTR